MKTRATLYIAEAKHLKRMAVAFALTRFSLNKGQRGPMVAKLDARCDSDSISSAQHALCASNTKGDTNPPELFALCLIGLVLALTIMPAGNPTPFDCTLA